MSDLLPYLAVLIGSLVPWFELFAIPTGIAGGLNPVAVGLVAFGGNALATVAIVIGWDRLRVWWNRRSERPPAGLGSRRNERGRRAFERFGTPALALQGPMVSGTYLAAILALQLGAQRRAVAVWSVAGIAIWSVVLVAVTVTGVNILD